MGSPLHVCHDPSPSFPAFTEYPFPVSFLAIVSLEKTFDWGGEQLAMYCGPDLGDLIIITLNKYALFTAPWLDHADSSFPAPSKLPLQSFFSVDASMCP